MFLRICPESPHRAPLATPSPEWPREVATGRGPHSRLGSAPAVPAWSLGEAAGPGGRGLGLCRPVEPTPSSRPQRPSPQLPRVSEFGCGRVPDGLPWAGSRHPLSKALCSAEALSSKRRPPKKVPAPPDLGPRAPKPAPEELHDVRRCGFQATAAQAEEQRWAWGCCGDPAFPDPAHPAKSARVTQRETSPRSHTAPARPSSAPPRLPEL